MVYAFSNIYNIDNNFLLVGQFLLPFLFSAVTDMVPPFFDVNLMALFNRLETA